MGIPNNVKFLRELHGWSQAELAERIGKTQGSIFKIENGTTKNPRYLHLIANAFGVSEMDLRYEKLSESYGTQYQDYGVRIVEARTELGYSREKLAAESTISVEYLSQVERQTIDLTVSFLTKMAQAGLDINYILTGKRAINLQAHDSQGNTVSNNTIGNGNNINIGNHR